VAPEAERPRTGRMAPLHRRPEGVVSVYLVQAFERGRLVCDVGPFGPADAQVMSYFAHELREEFPDAVIAIMPFRTN
jgi:hypothetical protein